MADRYEERGGRGRRGDRRGGRGDGRGGDRGDRRGGRGGQDGRGGGGGYGGRGGDGYPPRGGDGGGRGARGGPRGGPRGGIYVPRTGGIPAPNAEVTEVENAFQISKRSGGMPDIGSLQVTEQPQLPVRPGHGTAGKPVTLWANYFPLIPKSNLVLYKYSISTIPEIEQRNKKKQLVRLLLELPEYQDLKDDLVTDFASNIIASKPFEDREHKITYRGENEDTPLPNAQEYRLRVRKSSNLTVSHLTEYLTSTSVGATFGDKDPFIQDLNILLNHYSKASAGLAVVPQSGGTKVYSLAPDVASFNLGAGLLALRGFFMSVRVATSRILVNVNIAHGVFFQPGPLPQLMVNHGIQNLVKLEKFLSKKVKVQLTHLPVKKNSAGLVIPRIKTIFALAHKDDGHGDSKPPKVPRFGAGAKEVSFFLRDSPSAPGKQAQGKGKKGGPSPEKSSSGGKYITVFDYYRTAYNRQLTKLDLPVVNVGNHEQPIYLPAEVCHVLPGQACKQKLSPGQTEQMIRCAVRDPKDNVESIVEDGPRTLGLIASGNKKLDNFGVSIAQQLLTVPARVLQSPVVSYAGNKTANVRSGGWNLAGVRFNTGGRLMKWSALAVTIGRQATFDPFVTPVHEFHQALQTNGIQVEKPWPGQAIQLRDSEDDAIVARLKAAAERLDLVLVILPEKDTTLYKKIKHAGDVVAGIHTVCVTAQKFGRCQPQYFANVALKFNLKLGGQNQIVEGKRLGFISADKTMVVGIDVTHPSPGSAPNTPSVSAMVASINKSLGQWPAELRIQKSRQEMVAELDAMLESRLKLWINKGKHAAFPENILVYRDGVSEAQYREVLDVELPLLRKACSKLYPAPDQKKGLPRITIVVVGKRHHTRFYPVNQKDADDGVSNPVPGTIVDRGVTEVRNWDFFLQAHKALQGTARPAHYFVVHDEIFRTLKPQLPHRTVADILEEMTHAMCYIYGRATKAVSLCPPAYYADIVCERGRHYLTKFFDATPGASEISGGGPANAQAQDVFVHPKLRDTMFYI